MSKKSGQISSNTLSLRFMQNAAKAKQEREVEAAKAKVRTDEEWELSPDIKQSWGIGGAERQGNGHVTYEQSYLPFLFPGLSSTGTAARPSTSARPNRSEDEDDEFTDPSAVSFKSRRSFDKHGKEETAKPSPPPVQQPPVDGGHSISRGTRAISSHGRNSTTSSNPPKRRPPPHPVDMAPPLRNTSAEGITSVSGPATFMKPQIDDPRYGVKKKRPSSDVEGLTDGNMKKRDRKDTEIATFT